MRNPTRQNLLLTLAHPHPAAPLPPPPLSLCPPPARLTRLTPPTPLPPILPTPCTLRSLRPSSLRPAGNGDSTMQSLHSAITAPCNHLLRSTRQLPNSPSLRLSNKPESRQAGKLASWRAPRPLAPRPPAVSFTLHHIPAPRRPYPGVSKHRPPALASAPPPTKDGGPAYRGEFITPPPCARRLTPPVDCSATPPPYPAPHNLIALCNHCTLL